MHPEPVPVPAFGALVPLRRLLASNCARPAAALRDLGGQPADAFPERGHGVAVEAVLCGEFPRVESEVPASTDDRFSICR